MSADPPAPGPGGLAEPWRSRVESARTTILGHRPGPMIERQLTAVERSLVEAADDRARLGQATANLDPAKVTAELKAALRSRDTSEPLIASLRRKHETINELLNRKDRLDQRIETTVTDLETLAVRTSTLGLRDDDGAKATEELDQLALDVELLAEAHRELDQL